MTKLSDYANREGITYRTAYNHFKKGLISGAYQMDGGAIYIKDDTIERDDDVWVNISEILKSKGYSIRKEDVV
jgi:predicted site-specific integrase-resolvase